MLISIYIYQLYLNRYRIKSQSKLREVSVFAFIEVFFREGLEVFVSDFESFGTAYTRFSAKQLFCFCDVRLPLNGVVCGQRFKDDLLLGASQLDNLFREFQNGDLIENRFFQACNSFFYFFNFIILITFFVYYFINFY